VFSVLCVHKSCALAPTRAAYIRVSERYVAKYNRTVIGRDPWKLVPRPSSPLAAYRDRHAAHYTPPTQHIQTNRHCHKDPCHVAHTLHPLLYHPCRTRKSYSSPTGRTVGLAGIRLCCACRNGVQGSSEMLTTLECNAGRQLNLNACHRFV